MAQGNFKITKKKTKRTSKKNQSRSRPLIIKPKKKDAQEILKLVKSQKKKLINSTEKLVAAKVKHLELPDLK